MYFHVNSSKNMLFITHFETHEFAQIFMLFVILGSKSTHEHRILLPPAPRAQQQNCCFFSVLLDSHPTKEEATLAFGKKGLLLHIRVKSSILLFVTYLGPGHHWWKKLWQLEKPRENSSLSRVDKPSSSPQYTQYQQVWKHMEQKDLLNRQREGIHFNENCGENLHLIKTNKKTQANKTNKQQGIYHRYQWRHFPGSSFMTKAHFTWNGQRTPLGLLNSFENLAHIKRKCLFSANHIQALEIKYAIDNKV